MGLTIHQFADGKTMALPFIYFVQYMARHRMGAFPAFAGSILPSLQPYLLATTDSSLSSVFLALFTSKSVRSLKGGSILITIPDAKLSFMSPPRQYYLYFNTSDYSH